MFLCRIKVEREIILKQMSHFFSPERVFKVRNQIGDAQCSDTCCDIVLLVIVYSHGHFSINSASDYVS